MAHEYIIKTKVNKWTVEISPSTGYGFFEHDEKGEGGGLWFDHDKELDDFDGTYFVPVDVADAILLAGYKIKKAMFCNGIVSVDRVELDRRYLDDPIYVNDQYEVVSDENIVLMAGSIDQIVRANKGVNGNWGEYMVRTRKTDQIIYSWNKGINKKIASVKNGK